MASIHKIYTALKKMRHFWLLYGIQFDSGGVQAVSCQADDDRDD
jgi:hypothetical protein